MQHYPTQFQKKILWRALTGLSIFTLGGLLVGFIWLGSTILGYLQPVLIPLAVAGVIAYLLDPIVAWFQKKGMNRLRAVLCVFGSFVILALTFAAIIIPPIAREASNAIEDRHQIGDKITSTMRNLSEVKGIKPLVDYLLAPAHKDLSTQPPQTSSSSPPNQNTSGEEEQNSETKPADSIESPATPISETRLGEMLSKNSSKITSSVTSFLSKSTSKIIGTLGLILGLIMIPIYLYYFLIESAAIKDNWHLYVPLKASRFKTEVVETLREINGYLIAFFRGQVLVAFIDGVLVGISLMLFGLPYGLVIGVLMAFLGIIPFVGNVICLVPACIIAYVHFSLPESQHFLGESPWAYVAAVVAIFIVVQQINSLVTAPKIVGDSVGLHPMTVIFSMLFWSLILGGFIGALIAVPLTAAVKVIFVRYVWERKIMDSNPLSNTAETAKIPT